jgi:hypothetical protein
MNLPQIAHGAARTPAQRLRQALLDSAAARADGADAGPLTITPARVPRAPAVLAAALPGSPAAREERRALYVRCLAHYRRAVEAAAPHSGDDLGTAAAHFVAANLRALQGVEPTPQQFQALRGQLAAALRADFVLQDSREQQLQFEKLALLAVLMNETWTLAMRQGAAAMAHVRQGARGYLAEFLGLAPEQLALGDAGLSLRQTEACTA